MVTKSIRYAALIVCAALLLTACAPQPTAAVPTATALPVLAPTETPVLAPAATATTAAAAAPAAAASTGGATFTIVAEKTSASYIVREQLAKRDLPNDAVGKTSQVSGAIVLAADGTIDASKSRIAVDAASIQTDQGMRDNYVRRNVLQTATYKEIVFVPTAISGLPSPLPQSGAVNFQLTGDLTIRDVTKAVTWDVTGTIDGDTASGSATTSFTFADFKLSQPSVPVVLSIVDKITLKLDLTLQRSTP